MTHSPAPRDAVGDGIEIGPGVVVVDLRVSRPDTITPDDLRDAFAEALAQADEADLSPLDQLGDLDIHPL